MTRWQPGKRSDMFPVLTFRSDGQPQTREHVLPRCPTTIGRYEVNCKTCDALQADYQHAVTLYTNAERNLQGLREDDYKLAFEKAVQLRLACKDALAAVGRHWRQAHGHSSQAVGTS